ncbi:MAG: hypothetical protein HYS83_02105 [Candidatus Blackburnbacteria bacterium]|nr:hypothetical protein [Candidatus Blackburnbacteria bacterium]
MPIPTYLKRYFWDINPKTASPKKHPEYYIKRILELGDKRAFRWARLVFGRARIKNVARNARLSPRTRNYWERVL